MPMFRLPLMRWLPEWKQPGVVRADALAGLTNAVVVLPQGVAFATLAGMPPQYGLYAAMLPCIVAAMFGSSRLMVTGPANAISLTTMALITPLAMVGSPEYIGLVLTLTFLVGFMQLMLGLARVGSLVDWVPHSVVVGFTAGAAVLIANSQIGPALGLPLSRGTSVWGNLQNAWSALASTHWPAVAPAGIATLVTVVAAILAKPWTRWIPAMLSAVLVGSLAGHATAWLAPGWAALSMATPVTAAWPPLTWPDLRLETLRSLFGATLVMTLLALTEAAAIAKAMARKSGETLDGNQEFIGQGMANLVGAFFSAYPASGSFNRSAVNAESGARTPLSAVCAGLFLLLILLFAAPLIAYMPMAVIAGLLFVVAWGLLDVAEMKHLWHKGVQESVPMVVTMVATVTLSLEWAILLGITIALLVRRWAGRA